MQTKATWKPIGEGRGSRGQCGLIRTGGDEGQQAGSKLSGQLVLLGSDAGDGARVSQMDSVVYDSTRRDEIASFLAPEHQLGAAEGAVLAATPPAGSYTPDLLPEVTGCHLVFSSLVHTLRSLNTGTFCGFCSLCLDH